MVANITEFNLLFSVLRNEILTCYCRSQIFEMCHIFKGSVRCLYVMILACILVMSQQHILRYATNRKVAGSIPYEVNF
jgi:hypothetical protein